MKDIGVNIDRHLPYLLAKASAIVSLQIDDIAMTVGMLRNEIKVLIALSDSYFNTTGCTLNQLSEVLMVKQSTLSRVVEALVIEGFLERKTTMTDRRAININLTRLGTERAEILVNHAKKLDYQLREKLGNKETETLVEVLNQVIRRVR